MESAKFPTEHYLDVVVRFLNIIKYNDTNYTREERIRHLNHVYQKTARHFCQLKQQRLLKISDARLQFTLQCTAAMVVYGWARVGLEVMGDLSIHYAYMIILDDTGDDPEPSMDSFYTDLLAGRPQKHPWWQLINDEFPVLLAHYGPYCGLNMVRSTMDFFQGCWIEQHNLQGYPGSYDFPTFLRRMNGLGHCVGGSLFPKHKFNEKRFFNEITTAIAQIENWMTYVNDLLSFYKEFDDPADQATLVNNYAKCYRCSVPEALEKLMDDIIRCSEAMIEVFTDKDPLIVETITAFMHGYVTWHLIEPRYRLFELADKVASNESSVAREFRDFQASGQRAGKVDPEEWAYPTVAQLLGRP